MPKPKENKKVRRPSEFLIRVSDVALLDLLYKVQDESKPAQSRNAIVVECLKNWLPVMLENQDPTASLRSIVSEEMENMKKFLIKNFTGLKSLMYILTAGQNVQDKGLGYLIQQLEHILSSQAVIATLPLAEIDLGSYDKLPPRLQTEKDNAIKDILEGK